MRSILILLVLPFLICACSDTGEADKPVEIESMDTSIEDGTEVDLDTLPDLEDTLAP